LQVNSETPFSKLEFEK